MARKIPSTYAEHDIQTYVMSTFKVAADIGVDCSWFATNTRDSDVRETVCNLTHGVAG